jgi:predicted lipoprotein with Yx(FWY)xxD motif
MATFKGQRAGALVALALTGALALAACGTAVSGGGPYGGASTTNTTGSSVQLNLTCATGATVCTKTVLVSGKAKTVLATTSGMTLYYFTPDTATTTACTGACAKAWPPLTTTGSSVTGSGFTGSLSTLNDANGDQVLYNGHPLYAYSGDHAQTDANGEDIGDKWYVAFPGLAAAGAQAPAASPTSGGSGAGGY